MPIKKVYLFVSDQSGEEGVVAMIRPGKLAMPMVTTKEQLLPILQAEAKEIADRTGVSIKLIEFSVRREIKTITPQ